MGVISSSIFWFGVDVTFLGGLGFEGIHRAVLMNAWPSESPTNRRQRVGESLQRERKGSGDIGNGFAFQNKPTCQLFLICAQFSRATESYSSFLGSFSSCTCSLSYQVSLKLSYAGENRHDHFARVSCGISPRLRLPLE